MSEGALSRARSGDESAFRDLVEPYRRELHLHCYRILGSLQDAMPPQPYEYQGGEAIAGFIARERGDRRGANLRLVSTRANGQPAFGCYLPDPHAPIARAYGMMVLTLSEDRVSAITWFGERSLFAQFGLPRAVPE